jgi:hypothetical protein
MVAMELDAIEQIAYMRRRLAVHIYGPEPVYSYQTPQYVLRRRATYGGRKGRAAIRRLKAMGAKPMQGPS